jgi:carbamoyl-phosphate synthase small subunit
MRLREHGAMRAAVSTVEDSQERLLERVLASPGMTGADLARIVTTPHPYTVTPPQGTKTRYRVAAVDLGIKNNTPRNMAQRGMRVEVIPATSTTKDILATDPDGVFFSNGPGDPAAAGYADILATDPDGVFFSNGPGDPAAAGYAVAAMRGVLEAGIPVFGICFGSQILSRAVGLDTYKLRYGHRGVNQPVMDLSTGRVYITSHNHGFAAALPPEADTSRVGDEWAHVPPGARKPFGTPFGAAAVTHVNLNDGVVEGIRLLDKPAFAVQYHPEAAPGPHDAVDLFDQFALLMDGGNK